MRGRSSAPAARDARAAPPVAPVRNRSWRCARAAISTQRTGECCIDRACDRRGQRAWGNRWRSRRRCRSGAIARPIAGTAASASAFGASVPSMSITVIAAVGLDRQRASGKVESAVDRFGPQFLPAGYVADDARAGQFGKGRGGAWHIVWSGGRAPRLRRPRSGIAARVDDQPQRGAFARIAGQAIDQRLLAIGKAWRYRAPNRRCARSGPRHSIRPAASLARPFDPRRDDLAVLDQHRAMLADTQFDQPRGFARVRQARSPPRAARRESRTGAARPRPNGCPQATRSALGAALDGIAASLAVPLAACQISRDLVRGERFEPHDRLAQPPRAGCRRGP